MNTPEVLVKHADGAVIISINRPEQENAITRADS
jgi:enoyl-CoA hydratase/carnithine racemase